MYSINTLIHLGATIGKTFIKNYIKDENEKWNLLESKTPLFQEIMLSNEDEKDYQNFIKEYKNFSLFLQEELFQKEDFKLESCFDFNSDIVINYNYLGSFKSLKNMLLGSILERLIQVGCGINEIRRAFQYINQKELYIEYIIYQAFLFEESYLLYIKKGFSGSYGFVNRKFIGKFFEVSDEEAILINLGKKGDFHFNTINLIGEEKRSLIQELLNSDYSKATISKKGGELDMLIKEHIFQDKNKYSDLEKQFPFSDIKSSIHKGKTKIYTVKEKIKLKEDKE